MNSKNIVFGFLAIAGLMLCLFAPVPAYTQVTGATLTGTTSDPSGAAIPSAQISIRNLATGEIRTVVTDGVGLYAAPNLLPGNYEVMVSATGFATEVRTGIALRVGAQQVLNMSLQVGQVSQR